MLKCEQVTKKVGNKKILEDLSIHVEQGSIYGLMGHNGAGKTTTMRILTGLTGFSDGKVTLDGKSYTKKMKTTVEIGYLPEEPNFYSYLSGLEYLLFLEAKGSSDVQRKKAMDLFERVGLAKAAKKKIRTYSRGMKQRLGLAVAMMSKPKLLILDEPTSALDPSGRNDMFSQIKELKGSGTTVILSTHILDDIEKIADRIGMMKHGRILKEGNVTHILGQYVHNVYDIELSGEAMPNQLHQIRSLEWIDNVRTTTYGMEVEVNQSEKAQEQMLKALYENQFSVKGFGLRKPSLDEVFLSEVQA